jgi:methyl-accepting chemotaxis protein
MSVTNRDREEWIREATRVCRDAAAGNLESRLTRIDADPELAELLSSINHMLDMTDAFVREATASLEFASEGKYFRRVLPNGMLGSFRRAAQSINDATGSMHAKANDLHRAEQSRLELEKDFADAKGVMDSLARATRQVEKMSTVIDRIADQTNLLALNASIEAARVGEAGRGFAVVAQEVKRLANQASDATGQIQESVTGMHEATKRTVTAIDAIWETIKSSAQK